VCTLSHWPGTPTPEALRADLSAEIALGALARPDLLPDVEAVTIDHYDEDGVVALALLVVEGLAETHADLLVEAARVGDFGVVRDRHAALVAFALAALADPERTPVEELRPRRRPADWLEVCSVAAAEALRLLPALAERPEDHASLWTDEAVAYDASVAAIAEGSVSIEEHPDVDLAVVRVVDAVLTRPASPTRWAGRVVHPAAVHSSTSCLRVATISGRRYELRYRYESWVRLQSRRPRRRVDLSQLAGELSAAERSAPGATGASWAFDGAGAITPSLHLGEQDSALDPDRFVDDIVRVLADLDTGPPAWDPYAASARA
jgi:hypothetical protein